MTEIHDQKPKVFISYSWTTPEHEKWVDDLAHSLHDADIHVIFDKWDLRPGQDSIAFMEGMVLDPSITKIIMVIDQKYTERANNRSGGVGTESTILSQELYSRKETKDIVAVIAEPGAKPPVFYSSRIYLDLSDSDNFPNQFEQLVRWIYGRFEYERPKRSGQRPSYITEDANDTSLRTNTEYRFALDAIEKGKSNISGLINTYLYKFLSELDKLIITENDEELASKALLKNFNLVQPHIREYKHLLNSLCIHAPDQKHFKHFKKFLELSLKFLEVEPNESYSIANISLFESIIYQIFTSTLAVYLKNDELSAIEDLLEEIYIYSPKHLKVHSRERSTSFEIFAPSECLNYLKRIYPDKIEPISEFLKLNIDNEIVTFDDLVDIDIILYLKSAAITILESKTHIMWWPHLALNKGWRPRPLTIFSKAEKKSKYDELVKLFKFEDLSFIETIYESKDNGVWGAVYLPQWRHGAGFLQLKELTTYEVLKKYNLARLTII
ncbi:toll/interleukin-1 receptor domain-containing protein [Acinetobacter baumannii]|uniref:toll/interleukin-1 receptor domain-containing protein n=1 Tax=Acinetobacter baumannii TaxID=470 RepID=UPI002957E97D|nr:toll/interleukin-1 receptor domain-containing protein [Acinetobacter baumannii]